MAIKAAYELPYTGEEVQEMLEQTATNKNLIDGLAASLNDKVDKVAGKDLSTNDYTNEEKAKLSSLENGAQKNVQSDWNASSGDALIKNKPTIPTKVSELENDSGYTSNTGTVTGIMMNGASKGTNGIVNLGTVLTQHQDISGKADRADAIGSLTLSMNDTNYQITLSGTKVDGTPFTVSNVIDLPLESVVVSGSYNKSTKEVVLTLKDGSTIEFSIADLVSGLQSEITTNNKLSADLVQNGTTNKVFTAAEKTKLANIEEGAQQNVQADWNATSGDAFIKNKPSIPQGVVVDNALNSTSENPVQNKVINNALNGKQSTIADLNDIRSGANAGATAYQKPANGIPKTDLANDVQTSLGKADTALQSYTESDPTVPSHVKAITTTDISNWNSKQPALTFDSTPTAGSNNPVTSAGIKAYVDNATPTITMDDTPTSGSNNPVKSGGIYTALQGKQNTLTFDSTPTASSTNPVTSGGVKTALDAKANQSTTYTKTEVDALFDDVAYLGDDDGQATTLDFDPQADTVWNIPQTLGSSQQAQARANIGVVDVSGTNDGTNWTSITIGSTTKAIPSGGSSGDVNVIESITFNGTAATIDSTTKNAAISYTPPVTSVNNQTGAVSLALGDTNVIETVKVNNTALTPDANKAVDVKTHDAVTNHGTSDTTFALTPNILHVWDTVTSLTLTLAAPADATIVNEYMFQFTSGSTATTLSLPSTVTWDEDKGALTVESGYIYQVSILNNIALWARVAV